ncbi:hypothetical protein AB0C96_27740 [Streptomyces sp. NPDC048506]
MIDRERALPRQISGDLTDTEVDAPETGPLGVKRTRSVIDYRN